MRADIFHASFRIIVMSEGRVEDVGTHDELIDRQGIYSKLYSLQFPQEV